MTDVRCHIATTELNQNLHSLRVMLAIFAALARLTSWGQTKRLNQPPFQKLPFLPFRSGASWGKGSPAFCRGQHTRWKDTKPPAYCPGKSQSKTVKVEMMLQTTCKKPRNCGKNSQGSCQCITKSSHLIPRNAEFICHISTIFHHIPPAVSPVSIHLLNALRLIGTAGFVV